MTPYDPSMTISDYISQLEKHIQIMQHLVHAMKLAEQMARLHGQVKPAMYPQHNSWQQWTSPGFQQPNVYQGYGAPYSTYPTERGDAFRFFDHHKDALAPIQDMFNRSMTGGFANLFGTAGSFDQRTGAAINETQWVADMSPGKGGNFEFKVQSAAGINFAEMTIDELARKTANNGVLNHLINMVTTSPKGVNGSAWRVDGGRIVITIDNLGSFVGDENILPILRLTRPILDLRTKPMPVPDTTPPTANFLITRVLGKHSNVGDFEIEGYVSNDHPHKLSQTVINIIDLPMYINNPNDLQPTKEHPRTAWILSPNAVLTLLDIDGVLMNEVIKLKDLGEYPNVTVVKDFCGGVERIDPFPVGEKVDILDWFKRHFVTGVNRDDSTDQLVFVEEGLRGQSTQIEDHYFKELFESQEERVSGKTLLGIARKMIAHDTLSVNVMFFTDLRCGIIQVKEPTTDRIDLYIADTARIKNFVKKTEGLNRHYFEIQSI